VDIRERSTLLAISLGLVVEHNGGGISAAQGNPMSDAHAHAGTLHVYVPDLRGSWSM